MCLPFIPKSIKKPRKEDSANVLDRISKVDAIAFWCFSIGCVRDRSDLYEWNAVELGRLRSTSALPRNTQCVRLLVKLLCPTCINNILVPTRNGANM